MKNKLLNLKNLYLTLSITKKAVIWFTVSTIIQNAILFLTSPIYTRILSAEEYGIFSVYQSWQQIIIILSVVALDRCMTVGLIKYPNFKEEFLSSIQTLMTVTVLIFTLITYIFKDFFINITGLPFFIIITCIITALFNTSFANWCWLQRYKYNYKKLTVITLLTTLLSQVIATILILCIPTDNKAHLLIVSIALTKIVIYTIIYVSVIYKGKTGINIKYWKFALLYSVPLIPHAFSQIILNSSDRIMIDFFCTKEEVAYYGIVYSIAMVLNVIVISINSAIQPWFFQKIKEKDFTNIKIKTNNLLILISVLSILISLVAPEIIFIMAPSQYSDSIIIFPALIASMYFYAMYLCFANFESYYEKPFYFSIATSIGAVINIILNIILIPKIGYFIAGYTTLVCYIIFAIMHYVFMKKVCKEKINSLKVFDTKFILSLSIKLLFCIAFISILYKYNFIRYLIILTLFFLALLKRKKIIIYLKNFQKKL